MYGWFITALALSVFVIVLAAIAIQIAMDLRKRKDLIDPPAPFDAPRGRRGKRSVAK